MSKRNLTRRQSRRIHEHQARRRKRAASPDGAPEPLPEGTELGPEQPGRVITHLGGLVRVESPSGTTRRCHFRSNLGSLVTGDRVVWRDGSPYGVVEAVLPRESELCRPDPYGDPKPVAANIDRALIVIAPRPEPHFSLIDRYLVATEASGIRPALVINKCEALATVEPRVADKIEQMEELYGAQLGYPVHRVSAESGEGVAALATDLDRTTSVLVGQSGVGKSSLINRLLPEAGLRVGELSERERGSHTTTNAELLHLPGGGHLIDSPGVREFGLWHMAPEQVLENFIEFRPFLGRCKFRDCAHRAEPGCALKRALAEGAISERRMASCQQILESL